MVNDGLPAVARLILHADKQCSGYIKALVFGQRFSYSPNEASLKKEAGLYEKS